jgi:hypothetical protein
MFVAPLAMAGDLGSGDSGFLFSKNQVAATTISDQEMKSTQGRQAFPTFENLPFVGIQCAETTSAAACQDLAPGLNAVVGIAAAVGSLLAGLL